MSWNEASDYAGAMGTRHRATGTKRNDFREACKLWFVGRETEEFVPSLDAANRPAFLQRTSSGRFLCPAGCGRAFDLGGCAGAHARFCTGA